MSSSYLLSLEAALTVNANTYYVIYHSAAEIKLRAYRFFSTNIRQQLNCKMLMSCLK